MSKGMMTLGLGLGLAMATAANAGLTYNGGGGEIPDFSGEPGIFTSEIVVGDSVELADITVTLNGLNHTWAGDLIISISHSGGASSDLVHRVGRVGGTGFGDSSDYAGDYSFNDGFGDDLWAAAAGAGGGDPIPGGDYFATGEGSDAQISLLSVFGGIDISGTRTLTISDNAGGDTGSLGGWTLDVVPVPAPAAIAVLGLAGLAPRRRRSA